MRVLILDDMQVRHDAFAKIFSDHTVVHCLNYSDYLVAVRDGFDVVCLDHDINEEQRNGVDAADQLVWATKGKTLPRVIVHSTNMVGAAKMVAMLRDAGFDVKAIPFLF